MHYVVWLLEKNHTKNVAIWISRWFYCDRDQTPTDLYFRRHSGDATIHRKSIKKTAHMCLCIGMHLE